MFKNYIVTYQEIDEKYFKVYGYQIVNYNPNEELKINTVYILSLNQFPIKITNERNNLFIYLIVSENGCMNLLKDLVDNEFTVKILNKNNQLTYVSKSKKYVMTRIIGTVIIVLLTIPALFLGNYIIKLLNINIDYEWQLIIGLVLIVIVLILIVKLLEYFFGKDK